MLNHIVLMGRLTKDPELRRTQSGTAVASFSLAVERDFADKATGQRTTDFIDIVAWRGTAEFVSKYFTKGRMAVVEGRLQIRAWQDREGNNRRSAEVIAENVYFGDSRRDGDNGNYAPRGSNNSYGGGYAPAPQSTYEAPAAPAANEFAELSDDDGELPF
jgi:single-strand DNA-binding protein